jgi:hypothetical protein
MKASREKKMAIGSYSHSPRQIPQKPMHSMNIKPNSKNYSEIAESKIYKTLISQEKPLAKTNSNSNALPTIEKRSQREQILDQAKKQTQSSRYTGKATNTTTPTREYLISHSQDPKAKPSSHEGHDKHMRFTESPKQSPSYLMNKSYYGHEATQKDMRFSQQHKHRANHYSFSPNIGITGNGSLSTSYNTNILPPLKHKYVETRTYHFRSHPPPCDRYHNKYNGNNEYQQLPFTQFNNQNNQNPSQSHFSNLSKSYGFYKSDHFTTVNFSFFVEVYF